jgi:hypothetical protein
LTACVARRCTKAGNSFQLRESKEYLKALL